VGKIAGTWAALFFRLNLAEEVQTRVFHKNQVKRQATIGFGRQA
jgi:hypothetical protein